MQPVVGKRKRVSVVFAALADPTRRRILERLSRQKEFRVTELATPFRISLPAVSRHLRVLEQARLIRRRRKGREHLFQARLAGLKEARSWLAHYVAGWEFSFDELDELLRKEQRKGGST
jgi:DNA-binding transcriptional ArsR family regulator